MSTISTHVLDTATGSPAEGMRVVLERVAGGAATAIGGGETNADGRVKDLLAPGERLEAGTYRLRFDTGAWFARAGGEAFFPEVAVLFRVGPVERHYHVPLLLSPFGYSTYRGS